MRGVEPTTRFGLVAFSRGVEYYKADLTDARNDEKSNAMRWLKKQSPVVYVDPNADEKAKAKHHGTRADLALQRAFRMKPEVVFFVSDGEPTDLSTDKSSKQVETATENAQSPDRDQCGGVSSERWRKIHARTGRKKTAGTFGSELIGGVNHGGAESTGRERFNRKGAKERRAKTAGSPSSLLAPLRLVSLRFPSCLLRSKITNACWSCVPGGHSSSGQVQRTGVISQNADSRRAVTEEPGFKTSIYVPDLPTLCQQSRAR